MAAECAALSAYMSENCVVAFVRLVVNAIRLAVIAVSKTYPENEETKLWNMKRR
jgi:hypothetical protein